MRDFHPAAAIFELLEGEDLDNLVENIRTHTLLTPIWPANARSPMGATRRH